MPERVRAIERARTARVEPVNTALAKPYGLASITAIASSSESITSTHEIGAEHLDVGVAGDVVHAVGEPVQRRACGSSRRAACSPATTGSAPALRAASIARLELARARPRVASGPANTRRVLGIAEPQLAHAPCASASMNAVGDLAMDEHALGAGAALARRQVAADGDLVHGLAQRRVVEDDAGVLAAHLERDQQLGPIERGLEDAAADRPAAGEAQAAQLRAARPSRRRPSPVPTTTLNTPGGSFAACAASA